MESADVEALHAFCKRFGQDPTQLPTGGNAFSILNPRADGAVEAVAVSGPIGRFGNNFRQLVCSASVARRIGARIVYLPQLPQFQIKEAFEAQGLQFTPNEEPTTVALPTLYGSFFKRSAILPLQSNDFEFEFAVIDDVISRLCILNFKQIPKGDSEIAIHIRSGDVFKTDRPPNPIYPQPPLAYYLKVLDHFSSNRDAVVTIVYEDLKNPTAGALIAYLAENRVDYKLQSASFDEDMEVLFAHRTLVFGRGTLGKAIVSLSRNVERVYYPWTDTDMARATRLRNVKGYLVSERVPLATAKGQWANTPEQRALMLSYPLDNLEISAA